MSDSSTARPRPFIASSWTTLTLPLTSTFDDPSTEEGKKWISIIKPLTRNNLPGFLHGIWGRVTETPETAWLVTGWETSEALQQFERSSSHAEQTATLEGMSSSPPGTVHCDLTGFFWNHLTPHTSITDIYFPSPLSASTHDRLLSVRGARYFMAPGRARPGAYNGAGVRGWMEEVREWEGMDVRTVRFVDYWNSEELERKFKEDAGVVLEGGVGKGVWEHFLEECREAGMLGMREVHCAFQDVPTRFWD
ncbi:hypothetical protein BJ875DRAFT_181194 [Amylocarpus encephaloides]|uniref:Uncharacterized protein n=1 Tax=Amylocarpus encephaloides TaxID=45428 RepID=A0A9P7YAG6_9HELO|nr:hypothetical protein BJ875DRAFT_181194 [Amylocarpus encephaloides]